MTSTPHPCPHTPRPAGEPHGVQIPIVTYVSGPWPSVRGMR